MANNSLAIRFTENEYATKSEVAKELKTTLIDSFWRLILEYRAGFAREIPVRTINSSKLSLCLCPGVSELINNVELKIFSALSRYSQLSTSGDDLRLFKLHSKIDILQNISSFLDFDVDENYLRMLIMGNVKNIDPNHNILISYAKALDLLADYGANKFDEDLIADLYTCLSGNDELISLYRTNNDADPKNKVIIDRVYTSAPTHLLSGMMDSLISYIQTGSGSLLTKAGTVLYYINYAKPFAKYNELMAILLAKYVLADNGLENLSYFLNLESLLGEQYMEMLKINIEVQKSDDITYFIRHFTKLISSSFEKTYSIMNNVQALSLMDDYYKDALKEAKESIYYEETKTEEPIEVVEPITTVIEETETVSNKVEEVMENKDSDTSSLAISFIPKELDEKEAKRLEEHLLESDPELRRAQARFYARHCTMGKRYTIQQFKKEINCAYETARTSMDGLVTLGYYRQEMVKNKKVYTPIKRK